MAIHIDNGFMRKGESDQVKASLEKIGLSVHVERAGMEFMNSDTTVKVETEKGMWTPKKTGEFQIFFLAQSLHNVLCFQTFSASSRTRRRRGGSSETLSWTLPRGAINHYQLFAELSFNNFFLLRLTTELNLDPSDVLLGQGTLRPDLIESASALASGKADVIKTHHNDTDLVRKLRAEKKVVEPLTDFHKDEVRRLGMQLDLPRELVERHPFPGPGLGIRVLCQSEPHMEKDFAETQVLCRVVVNFAEMVEREHALLNRIESVATEAERKQLAEISGRQKYVATLMPIRTVGVQGDCRTYSYAVGISCDQDPPDWQDLLYFARLIPRVCHNINRVCYVFGGLVEHPIQDVTPTFLTPIVLSTVRQADHLANQVLRSTKTMGNLSQMPVVLLPVHFDRSVVERSASLQRSVALRPFKTNDFMTGLPAVPGEDIPEEVVAKMVSEIMTVPGISRVLYDLTSKPPGTTEWE